MPPEPAREMDAKSDVTLNRLLGRLEHTLLSPAADVRLRTSQYERNRIGVNVEHARALLLTLEKQSATIRVQTQRQQVQAELAKRRDVIKRLNARLEELNKSQDTGVEEEEDDDDEDGGDEQETRADAEAIHGYAPARADTQAGLEAGEPQRDETNEQQQQPALRARKPLQASDNRSAASTTAREELFAGRKQHPDVEGTETLMSHNRSEQEVLSEGLLGLARALKESSISFSSSLESEKDVLKRAEGGLDKSAQGMEQADTKMGMLRRMSEGQGWWGRIKLYGFIAGLWLACFLLVFVGPKLRF